MAQPILLETRNLRTYFPVVKGLLRRRAGEVKAVDDVNLAIREGETFGLVGESGCGKSTLGRSILQLIQPTGGEVLFHGENLLGSAPAQRRAMRRKLQIVFQDPYASLNPRMLVGDIVGEPLRIHEPRLSASAVRERVEQMLRVVGLPEDSVDRYPHEFSGGQRQRICISRALILRPEFVVCDEPVSALDVSVRSQVLNLLRDLQRDFGLTYLFISHDLSVVKHISDRVGVMYLGRIVELADKEALYREPLHPYTQALLSAIPVPDVDDVQERIVLEGDVPSPFNPPSGCRFRTRCPKACADCAVGNGPELREVKPGHWVACPHSF